MVLYSVIVPIHSARVPFCTKVFLVLVPTRFCASESVSTTPYRLFRASGSVSTAYVVSLFDRDVLRVTLLVFLRRDRRAVGCGAGGAIGGRGGWKSCVGWKAICVWILGLWRCWGGSSVGFGL